MQEQFLKEDLLQYLWNIGNFEITNLITTKGETLQIIERGILNHNAGPDFINCKIIIDNTLWVGNIEIHKYSSDWIKHKHHQDPAYNNVILHVVYKNDLPIKRKNDLLIPCLELHNRIKSNNLFRYKKLMHNKHWIPCQHFFSKLNPIIKSVWLDNVLIKRLEYKTKHFQELLKSTHYDWESILYIGTAKYLSSNVNKDQMEELAIRTPLKILLKHQDDLLIIESILFGQSGLLENVENVDAYTLQLKNNYTFYKKKYNLTPMISTSWKFSKMRPANFPTIRIAQLASYIANSKFNFSRLLNSYSKNINIYRVQVSEYWKTHYTFGVISKSISKYIGKTTIDILFINVVVPLIFHHGQTKDNQEQKNHALMILSNIDAEKNSIINNWVSLGQKPQNAYDTQALIELKNNFCNVKKCLNCSIGNAFMNTSN